MDDIEGLGRYLLTMRLGAIDVGSNSVHMIVADVSRDGHLEVVDRVKEMVRLGRRSFTTGRLTAESMDLAVRALVNFKKLLRVRRVERLRAVATSAVREARNRTEFIRRIKRETGLTVEVISGLDEARLIFQAARHALGLDGGPHLLVDVGGGSVELVLVRDGRPLWMRSVKLGAARLAERFLLDDPPTRAQLSKLEVYLERTIGPLMRKAKRAGVVRAIGTSGTINTLVAMARSSRGEELGRLHGASASAGEISDLSRDLVEANAALRVDLPGMDAKRVDLMPAAATLVNFILKKSGAPELVACTWALREGVLLGLAHKIDSRSAADARRRSVGALATRFAAANDHGKQVAKLALKLFDATAPVLGLPKSSRELLEFAALLHDIGHAIDHDRHNRHSYYLIKNAELFGFDTDEIEVIAQAARGHRKQAPKLDSPDLKSLSPAKRRVVRGLAAILRVADALDRSHFGVVKNIEVRYSPGRVIVGVDSKREKADLELWTCERRTDLLSRLLDRQVVLQR
ncbi:MAG: Ppx/GppA phosphatase family protein [Candidatus Binatus sp.]|uniref:Ppx/GppA phosphatase family protein n=1 Tax=Candidatus Binatus sp. TaxID=2811406 RepID=UPI003C73BEFB